MVSRSSDGERGPGCLCTGPTSQTFLGDSPINHYAAIDVSLELSSVCIVDATGKVVKATKVETHPEALVKFLEELWPSFYADCPAARLSRWLYDGPVPRVGILHPHETGYKIFDRYKEHGLEALSDRSRRPVTLRQPAAQPGREPDRRASSAIKPHWGARKIRELLLCAGLPGDLRLPAKSTDPCRARPSRPRKTQGKRRVRKRNGHAPSSKGPGAQ